MSDIKANETSQKSAKSLEKTTKNISETDPKVFEDIATAAGGLFTMGSTVANYLSAQFTAGTIDAQMEIFTQIMELFKSESGKAFIDGLIKLTNFLINGAATLIDLFTKATDFILFVASGDWVPGRNSSSNNTGNFGTPQAASIISILQNSFGSLF